MKLKFSILTFLIFLLVKSSSAQTIQPNQIKAIQIEKIQGKEIILGLTVYFENPTNKNLSVAIKKGKLYKDGVYMGSFQFPQKIKLHKKMKEDIQLKVKVNLEKPINLLQEGLAIFSGHQPEVKVSGKFKVSWIIFYKRFPFEYQEKISLF
jgi:LEA14-like dessication related protein